MGCSHDPGPLTPRAANGPTIPSDFALAVTVIDNEGPMAPARYVVEPDGVLRAAQGPGASLDTYPPRTRELTRAQLNLLYRQAIRGGFDRGTGGTPHRAGARLTPGEGESIVIVEAVAHDARRITRYDPGGHPEAESLVRTLAELARAR